MNFILHQVTNSLAVLFYGPAEDTAESWLAYIKNKPSQVGAPRKSKSEEIRREK